MAPASPQGQRRFCTKPLAVDCKEQSHQPELSGRDGGKDCVELGLKSRSQSHRPEKISATIAMEHSSGGLGGRMTRDQNEQCSEHREENDFNDFDHLGRPCLVRC